ncbi:MAG: DUF503 domain-containing protein [Candidatus Edwardsbacteria bacterium]
MIVGTCQIELYIPQSDSLKFKRRVLKSLKERLRQQFNISVSETDNGNLWQRATLGIAMVSNGARFADEIIMRVVDFIRGEREIEVIDYRVEMR